MLKLRVDRLLIRPDWRPFLVALVGAVTNDHFHFLLFIQALELRGIQLVHDLNRQLTGAKPVLQNVNPDGVVVCL